MNFRIRKIKSSVKSNERFEVRAWDGSGDDRLEWRRRFKTKSEAQTFIDGEMFLSRQAKLDVKQNAPTNESTFGEEYEFWAKCKLPCLSPSYAINVQKFWQEFGQGFANKRIEDIRPQHVRELEAKFKAKGNSDATILKKIVWIKSVLNFSVENERIKYNPIARVKLARPRKPELNYWDVDQAKAFLARMREKYPHGSKDEFAYLVYLTALNTGLRAGEIWGLKPKCLKPSEQRMVISEQFDLRVKGFRTLKGKETRNVPLQPALAAALLDFIQRREIKPDEVIFSSVRNTPIDHNNFAHRYFERDVAECETRIKFHGLRHTAATLMLDANVGIRTVQEILGHKDLETTQRYVHVLGRNIAKASMIYSLYPQESVNDSNPTDPKNLRHLRVIDGA